MKSLELKRPVYLLFGAMNIVHDNIEWLQVNSGAELVAVLMDCDIIVYHIGETASQVDEASGVIQGTH